MFLDLSAAFDTVNHLNVLYAFTEMVISGKVLVFSFHVHTFDTQFILLFMLSIDTHRHYSVESLQ